MRVLALMGSPRIKGNNAALLAALLEGLESGGAADVWKLNLHQIQVRPCMSCNACSQTGECVQRDDMTAIYPLLNQSDLLVMAAPIYFSGLCAQAKLLIDRCQPYWALKYVTRQDVFSGRRRRGYFISTCGQTENFNQFAGAQQVMGTFYHMLGIQSAGNTLLADIDRQPVSGRPDMLDHMRSIGKNLALECRQKDDQ